MEPFPGDPPLLEASRTLDCLQLGSGFTDSTCKDRLLIASMVTQCYCYVDDISKIRYMNTSEPCLCHRLCRFSIYFRLQLSLGILQLSCDHRFRHCMSHNKSLSVCFFNGFSPSIDFTISIGFFHQLLPLASSIGFPPLSAL